jgi:hypothetical protein
VTFTGRPYRHSHRAIFNTIMTPERIFRSARIARGLVPYNFFRPAISLPSRKLGVCTIAMSVELLRGIERPGFYHPLLV